MKNLKLYIFSLIKYIFSLSPLKRKIILSLIDSVIIFLVCNIVIKIFNISHQENQLYSPKFIFINLYLYLIPCYFLTGVYRPITRYINGTAVFSMFALEMRCFFQF